MGETNKKPYSKELSDVLDYMIDILSNEFPTDMFTPEYLMVAILDVKKCHANCILDNYLMSENMNEIREIYTSVLNNTNHLPIKDSNEKADFDSELGRILEMAEVESDKLSTNEVGTEHVLLSILNPENNFRLSEVFRSVGIDYAFLFDRCQPTSASTKAQKKARPQRNRNFINSNGWNQNPQPQIIPLKSEINTTSTSESSEYVSKYTTNINELCNNGSIDKIIGRKREINQIIEILARRKKNNVILTGNAGVGKTSIVYSLAQLIENGEVPPILEKKQIVQLNIMALVSGTHFRGMFEERIKGLFDELKNSSKYILFIDDMQSVLKSTGKDKDTDISSMIGDILTEGKVRVIGTISFKDYRNSIEYNPAISHRLQKIVVEPTTVSETIEILNSSKKNYEDFHNVNYSDEVIKKCVELSERYISDRCLPDSAFDVMDMTGAYASLKKKASDEFMALKRRLYEIEEEKNEVLNHGDFEKVDAIIIEENDVNRRINEMKREASSDNNRINVTVDDLRRTISEMTNVPISRLSHDEKAKIATIDKTLKEHVIGQDEAVESICSVIKRNKVGLGGSNRPIGAFLLAGRSGCGKTLIAKKLAEEIFGDEKALIRIDMSEYSEKNSVAKLTGSAPGYIGYENGGQLTEAVKNKQHCVLLLDEIEKADQEVHNLFLQLLDEGRLTDNTGQIVNFKNVIILMTSNVGAKQAAELGAGVGFSTDAESNSKSIIDKELKKSFSPEFLNRIDKIVHFNDLTDDNLKDIVKLEINKFGSRLKKLKYDIKFDDSVVDFIHKESIKQKDFGARPIIRLVQTNLEDAVTDLMLKNDYEPEYVFSASCREGQIVVV